MSVEDADRFFERSSDFTRQIEVAHHLEGYLGDPGNIYFILQNLKVSIEIQYNTHTGKLINCEMYQRLNNEIFRKIWNNNGLRISKLNLVKNDINDTTQCIEQYYFIDSRNNIQIIFPNYT